MRKKIVAGNWKMNKNYTEAQELMHELDRYKKHKAINCEVYIAPPALYITTAKNIFLNDNVGVFAQDMSEHTSGAYTGEISADMLASVNATGAIIGHSERRQYHGETDSHCNRKVKLALDNGLVPIYCNGETLEQRKSGQHFEVIKNQTEVALFTLSAEEIKALYNGETVDIQQAHTAKETFTINTLPADKNLTINWNLQDKQGNASIYSIQGACMQNSALDYGQNTFNVASWPEGLYILKLRYENKEEAVKFMIKH